MLSDLIGKSRKDAQSQGLRQLILVERHLCEREIGEKAAKNCEDILSFRCPGPVAVCNARAVETSRTMVAWEADDEEGLDFDGPAQIKFVTDFNGEVVRITAPVYYQKEI